MNRTTNLRTTGPGRAAASDDGWDDDELGDGEEPGPSWTKSYVGGVKVRQYAAERLDGPVLARTA